MQELLDAQKETRYPSPVKVGALLGVVGVFLVVLLSTGVLAAVVEKIRIVSFIREDWSIFIFLSSPISFGVVYMAFFGNPTNLYATMFVAGAVCYELMVASMYVALVATTNFVKTEGWLMVLAYPFLLQLGLVLVAMFAFVVWLLFGLGRQVSIFRNRLKAIEMNRKN